MEKEVHYLIENKIITNTLSGEELIELFNKKLAAIILNIENDLRDYNAL